MYSTYPTRGGATSAASSNSTALKGKPTHVPVATIPNSVADDMKSLKEELAKLQGEEAKATDEERQRHGFVKRVRASRSVAGNNSHQKHRGASQSYNTLGYTSTVDNFSFGGNESRDENVFVPLSDTIGGGNSELLNSTNDASNFLQGAYLQSGQTPPLIPVPTQTPRHRGDATLGPLTRGPAERSGGVNHNNGNNTNNNNNDKTFLFSEQMENERHTMMIEAMALRQAHTVNKKSTVPSSTKPLTNNRKSTLMNSRQSIFDRFSHQESNGNGVATRRLPFMGPMSGDDQFLSHPNALLPSGDAASTQAVSALIHQIANASHSSRKDTSEFVGNKGRAQSISLLSQHFGGGLYSGEQSKLYSTSPAAAAHAEALKELQQALREEGLPLDQPNVDYDGNATNADVEDTSSMGANGYPSLKRVGTTAPGTMSQQNRFAVGPTTAVKAFEYRVTDKFEELAERERNQQREAFLLRSGALGIEERVQRDGTFLQPNAQANERYQLSLIRKEQQRSEEAHLKLLSNSADPKAITSQPQSSRNPITFSDNDGDEGLDTDALAVATAHTRLVMRHVNTAVRDTKSYVSNFRKRLGEFDARDVARALSEQSLEMALERLNNEAKPPLATAPPAGLDSTNRVLTLEELEALEAAEKAAEEAEDALRRSKYGVAQGNAPSTNALSPFSVAKAPDPSNKYLLLRDKRVRIIQRLYRRRVAQKALKARKTEVAKYNADRVDEEERTLRDVPIGSGDPELDAMEEEIAELEHLLALQAQQIEDYYSIELTETRELAAVAIQQWFRRNKSSRQQKAKECIQRATRLYQRRREMALHLATGRGHTAQKEVEAAVAGAVESKSADDSIAFAMIAMVAELIGTTIHNALTATHSEASVEEGRVFIAKEEVKEAIDEAVEENNASSAIA